MKIVLDTNVWISGLLLPKSNAGIILQSWQQGQYNIVISAPILKEIERVLQYPKIAKRLKWEKSKIRQYLELLGFFTELITVDECRVEVEKDPDDSPILATLIVGQASWLVTGDNMLLELKDKYPIITAKDFCVLIDSM